MIGAGDIAAIVQAVGFGVAEYQRERTAAHLQQWAELMAQGEPNEPNEAQKRAIAIRQFAQDRMQDRGFCPWYEWTEHVGIPKDLLCDIMDLLIEPVEAYKGHVTKFLDAARRACGFKSVAEKDRAIWAELIQDRKPDLIVEMLETQVARRGRQRAYSASPVIDMDLDWIADCGMWLING